MPLVASGLVRPRKRELSTSVACFVREQRPPIARGVERPREGLTGVPFSSCTGTGRRSPRSAPRAWIDGTEVSAFPRWPERSPLRSHLRALSLFARIMRSYRRVAERLFPLAVNETGHASRFFHLGPAQFHYAGSLETFVGQFATLLSCSAWPLRPHRSPSLPFLKNRRSCRSLLDVLKLPRSPCICRFQ